MLSLEGLALPICEVKSLNDFLTMNSNNSTEWIPPTTLLSVSSVSLGR